MSKLSHYEPRHPHTPARLPAPTPAQITGVTDVLEHRWASNALMVQDRYTQAIERDDHNAASKWALAGAISTDKILVLKGRPTDIVGHVHAHRHDLGDVMDKLARAVRTRGLGPVMEPVAHPVAHLDPHPTIIVASPSADDASLTSPGTGHDNVSS